MSKVRNGIHTTVGELKRSIIVVSEESEITLAPDGKLWLNGRQCQLRIYGLPDDTIIMYDSSTRMLDMSIPKPVTPDELVVIARHPREVINAK